MTIAQKVRRRKHTSFKSSGVNDRLNERAIFNVAFNPLDEHAAGAECREAWHISGCVHCNSLRVAASVRSAAQGRSDEAVVRSEHGLPHVSALQSVTEMKG